MTKFRSHLDSPSNKALQIYLDDLTINEDAFSPKPFKDQRDNKVISVQQVQDNVTENKSIDTQANLYHSPSAIDNNTTDTVNSIQNVERSDMLDSKLKHHHTDNSSLNLAKHSHPISCNEKLDKAKDLIEQANAISNLLLTDPESLNSDQALQLADGLLKNTESITQPNLQDTLADSKEIPKHADNHTKREIRNEQLSLYNSLPSRFQVLLCDVGEQTIAIPLVELGGIMQVERFTKRSSKQSWYYGLFVKGEQTFTCIDSARYLSNADNSALKKDKLPDDQEYKYVVQLGKSEFAICCHSVSTTLEVEKQDVKWKQNVTKQPWFAGILKTQMHALIDGAEMVRDVLNRSGAT